MAVVTDSDPYEKLLSLPTWVAYAEDPGQPTLRRLLHDADANELRGHIPRALAHLFMRDSHWKVAQHLANVLIDIEDVTLARYYAGKAVLLSGGDILTKLSFARCLWLQRFPEALIELLNQMYAELDAVEPSERRNLVRYEIVELYVWVFCYCNKPDLARSWVEMLVGFSRFRIAPIVHWMKASHHLGFSDLAFSAAAFLAQGLSELAESERTFIRSVAQVRLLELMRERQYGK